MEISGGNYAEAKEHILKAIDFIAVDEEDGKIARKMVSDMEKANAATDAIIFALALCLRDIVSS